MFIDISLHHRVAVLCSVTQSCLTLCHSMVCSPPGSSVHGDSPCNNTRGGYHALLQGIFLSQGSNPGLLYCRQILYHLSHQGSPFPNVRAFKKNQNQTQQNCVIPIIYLLEMGKILNHKKRNGILLSTEDKINPFAITSEVSQKQKDKY